MRLVVLFLALAACGARAQPAPDAQPDSTFQGPGQPPHCPVQSCHPDAGVDAWG